MPVFPVDEVIPSLVRHFETNDLILSAPPGAGKSTRVPMALMEHFPNKRFLLLQPRRVVVRHLANFLASLLNEKVGQTIGYRMRGETQVSSNTRLTLVTDGVLTRMLQQDPELTGIDGVLFDEFHERNVHADMGLALAIESQQGLRDDLRLLIMSATLDVGAIQTLLPEAKVFSSQGKMFDVTEHYLGDCNTQELAKRVASAIQQAIKKHHNGDVLVFLPSVKHIRQCQRLLHLSHCDVHPLFGGLSLDEQSCALAPAQQGRRKIVLATNIAETSLTIDGITVVIDSGRENQARFDHGSAMTTLDIRMISQASATQRMGRAGRTASGDCYRLWSQSAHGRLAKHAKPQIKEVDLTSHLLDVCAWGADFDTLPLLDKPDSAQVERAQKQLESIGALSVSGQITQWGKKLANVSLHPGVANMLLTVASETPQQLPNAVIGAVLYESIGSLQWEGFDTTVAKQLSQPSIGWKNALGRVQRSLKQAPALSMTHLDKHQIAAYIGQAFMQRVAFRVKDDEWKMASGPRAIIDTMPSYVNWCVVLHGQAYKEGKIKVFAAIETSLDALKTLMPQHFISTQSLFLDKAKQLKAQSELRFFDIVYERAPLESNQNINWSSAWLTMIKQGQHGLPSCRLPLNQDALQWLERVKLLVHISGESDREWEHEVLLEKADQWLTPALDNCRSIKQLESLPWQSLLQSLLPWDQSQQLASLCPSSLEVASGRTIPIVYSFLTDSAGKKTWRAQVSVKMQECYGMTSPVFVARGACRVTFALLSPANRPLQTTDDLAAFWQGSYLDIAKEMRGRYPKHFWPDNPANSPATTVTKAKMKGVS
ncbi:ATP-dependent helicase HrpB [Alteromonas sediminis]|uniref:ATP-dependent helicase HrpB n=1 Tax=Alteromonas sediminis TaxID=2259342 RepID=A0A3N5Z6X8_9ALTE|nr:ATP-dependent helicase HrpB [Alteromonas sediminis]RPJ66404.1 ATP-dependent helicase HrpB [Alteromonas sediminis]